MNLAIVEDQDSAREQLSAILNEYARKRQTDLQVRSFASAEALLEGYRPLQYTALFLDIYLGGMTGIRAAEAIRAVDPDTLLIFLTDSSDHMPEAFSVHAYEYLSKPVDRDRIFRVLDDILQQHHSAEDIPSLAFSTNRSRFRIPYSDIVAIQANGNYLEITDRSGSSFRPRMTFSEAQQQLSGDPRFLLLLRGVLVNMDSIVRFQDGSCHLEGNIQLPVSTRNEKAIIQTWQNYMFSKIRKESLERSFRS